MALRRVAFFTCHGSYSIAWGTALKIKRLKSVDLDRIERAYLASLRVAILAVATLCLLGAILFGVNAAWRVFVSTDVKEQPVQVTGAQVAEELKKAVPARTESRQSDEVPRAVRARHAQWARDVFSKYYAIYRVASQTYKKPEDETLSEQKLIEALGYDLDTYAAGEEKAAAFIDNEVYQQQALAAVTAAMRDPTVVVQLTEYKAAEKTARACTTTNQRREMWDSYSTACDYWWEAPQGCQVTRNVPVETCVAAYPEGIVSPRVAFGRADGEFFRLWSQQTAQVRAEAQATRDGREATRAQIGPNLMLALQVLGAFLVVMFFFLMVAIERHLRLGARRSVDPVPPAETTTMSEPAPSSQEATPEVDTPGGDNAPPSKPRWDRRR